MVIVDKSEELCFVQFDSLFVNHLEFSGSKGGEGKEKKS